VDKDGELCLVGDIHFQLAGNANPGQPLTPPHGNQQRSEAGNLKNLPSRELNILPDICVGFSGGDRCDLSL